MTSEQAADLDRIREAITAIPRLRARIVTLEQEVQENRQLNRRLAELLDVITELLVPLAKGDKMAAARIAELFRSQV